MAKAVLRQLNRTKRSITMRKTTELEMAKRLTLIYNSRKSKLQVREDEDYS